jgi:hypothetical protein
MQYGRQIILTFFVTDGLSLSIYILQSQQEVHNNAKLLFYANNICELVF